MNRGSMVNNYLICVYNTFCVNLFLFCLFKIPAQSKSNDIIRVHQQSAGSAVRKACSEHLTKSTKNNCVRVSFLINLQSLGL